MRTGDTSERSFGIRRTSATPRRRPRSQSQGIHESPDSNLLARCLDILGSIVQEDCRFRASRTRLNKPPYMLQLVTINIARLLASFNWHKPDVMAKIGIVMIPAFYSFPTTMHTLLLQFFEESILRTVLQSLSTLR